MNSGRRKIRLCADIVFMVIIGILAVIIGKNYRDEEIKNNEKQSAEDTGKVLNLWYSYTAYEPYLKEAAARYGEATGVEVKLKYCTSLDYMEEISSASSIGEGPDMYIISESSLQNAVLLGIAEQNYETEFLTENNYNKKALQSVCFAEKMYGYPLGFETSVMAVNMEYVDALPETFDDIKAFADNFNNVEGETSHDYSKVASILKWDVSDILYSYGFLGAYLNVGGEYGDNPQVIDVNSSDAVAAGQYYFSLAEYFYTDIADASYENVIKDFMDGKIIYTVASADIIGKIGESQNNIKLITLPKLTDDLKSKQVSVTDIVMINPFGNMKNDAVKFAKLLSYDMADEMYMTCGIIGAKKINYDDENINIFQQSYNSSVGMPKLMTTADYWLKVNNISKNIWTGSDVKEQLDGLYQELDSRIN